MSEDLRNLFKDAESFLEEKKFDDAIEFYKKIMNKDPQNEEACYKVAQIYAIRGLITLVINQYFILIDILEIKDNLERAIEVCNSIIKLDPENINARMKEILLYKKQDKNEEIVKKSLVLTRLLIDLGKGEQAVILLQETQKIAPDNLVLGSELAEIYMSNGQIPEAVIQFNKIAQLYIQNNLIDKAIDAYKRLKVLLTDDIEVILKLGRLYFKVEKYQEAEAEFRLVLRHNLNDLEALDAIGEICHKKGQSRDAILAYNKILSINPQEVGAQEKLGELYQEQGNLSEAVKYFLMAAQNYQMNGNIQEAILTYKKVLVLDATNPTACRELTNLGVSLITPEVDKLKEKTMEIIEEKLEIVEPIVKLKPLEESKISMEIPPKISLPLESADIEVEKTPLEYKKEAVKGLIKIKSGFSPKIGLLKTAKAKELPKIGFLVKDKVEDKTKLGLIKSKLKAKEYKKPVLLKKKGEFSIKESAFKEGLQEALSASILKEEKTLQELKTEKFIEILEEEDTVSINDMTLAMKTYLEKIEKFPENFSLRKKLAEIYLNYGFLKEAILEYKEIFKNTLDLKCFYNLIYIYSFLEDFEGLLDILKEFSLELKTIENSELQIEIYQKILLLDEDNIYAREELANIYLKSGHLQDALFHLEILAGILINHSKKLEAIEVYKKILSQTVDRDIQLKLAELYKSEGEIKEAVEEYSDLALFLEKDNPQAAVSYFEEIVNLEFKNLMAHEKLIDLYGKFGDEENALAESLILVDLYLDLKELDKAQDILLEILNIADEPEVRLKLMNIYFEKIEIEKGNEQALKVIEEYLKQKKYNEVIEIYQKLISLNKDNINLREELSKIYILAEEKEKAKQELLDLVNTLKKQEAWSEIVNLYCKILELDPQNAEINFNLGIIYSEYLNDKNKAIFYLEETLALEHSNLEAYLRLIRLYIDLERIFDAAKLLIKFGGVESFEKLKTTIIEDFYLKINNNPQNLKLRYNLGLFFKELNLIDDAIEQFQQVKRDESLLLSSYYMLGLCFAQKPGAGMFDLAVRQFEKALELKGYKESDYLELKYDLARLYEQQNMFKEALRYYQEIYVSSSDFKDIASRIGYLQDKIIANK